jgi:hypothetical protein
MNIKEIQSARETDINEAQEVSYTNILKILYDNYRELTELENNAEDKSPAILPSLKRETGDILA